MRNLTETELGEFSFTEAADGVEGLAKFNPRTTDIVFVDWNMPNMDGTWTWCGGFAPSTPSVTSRSSW